MNGTGTPCEGPLPGRCSTVQQRGPGRHPETVRVKWNKEVKSKKGSDGIFLQK